MLIQQIDDHMRLIRVHADGRIELSPLAGHARVVANQIQRQGQPRVIPLGPRLSEFPASPEVDVDNVLIGLPGRPIRHGPAQ
jgi:hypothetical protein